MSEIPLTKQQIESLLDKHAGDTYGFLAAYAKAIRVSPRASSRAAQPGAAYAESFQWSMYEP